MKFLTSIVLSYSAAAAFSSAAEIVVNPVVDDFLWSNPFGIHSTPPGFDAMCEATGTFQARQHLLSELQMPEPTGLQPWAKALKYFFGGRPFPGSWDGVDAHGTKRDVILMNYTALPEAVKRWIEVQKKDKISDGMWLFGVYHKNKEGIKIKATATPRPRPTVAVGEEDIDNEAARLPPDENLVVLFAAGAIYHILPLWVAEGSMCEAELLNLNNYGSTLKDGGVTAWVVEHTEPNLASQSREISFKIRAQLLRETEEGRVARIAREKEEAEASLAAAKAGESADTSQSQGQTHAQSGQGSEKTVASETNGQAAKDGSKDEL